MEMIIEDIKKCDKYFNCKKDGMPLFAELYGKYSSFSGAPHIANNPLLLQNHPEIVHDNIVTLYNYLKIIKAQNVKSDIEKIEKKLDYNKVFIVHGHNDEVKEKAARFVEKMGLTAIILHEQPSSGRTIIEKVEILSDVGFAIVLYTPCDKGRANGDADLKGRARQNVVFEHGYLIGKLGRERVCALVKGEIETPGDISGVVYVEMDSAGAWKYKLIDEMNSVGYGLDKNKI